MSVHVMAAARAAVSRIERAGHAGCNAVRARLLQAGRYVRALAVRHWRKVVWALVTGVATKVGAIAADVIILWCIARH